MSSFHPDTEHINDWKKQYPKVRGSIYLDHSTKGAGSFGRIPRHNAYRAEVSYGGRRYRKRSIDFHDCLKFLLRLHEANTPADPQFELDLELPGGGAGHGS